MPGHIELADGLTEPAEKALVKDLVADSSQGRAYGLYHFIIGASAIPAVLLTGSLWERFGAPVALTVGAALAGVSALWLLVWGAERRPSSLT